MLSLGSGLSGVLRGPSWPELQLSKRVAGVNVPMVCVAEVLSLVFCWRPPVCAGGVLAEKGKPSLAEVLSLGLSLFGTSRGSGELELQLSTRAAGVNVPMACAAKVLSLVSGLWPPVLNETKLRENATNNPRQRCICSKHGFHPGGHVSSWGFGAADFENHA